MASRAARRWFAILSITVLAPALSACGTDVLNLLSQQDDLLWAAEEVVMAAEDSGTGLEEAVYRAEDEKIQACVALDSAASARFNNAEPTWSEETWGEVQQFVAWLVPIESVESCAEASRRYRFTLANVCGLLRHQAFPVDCTGIRLF